MIKDMRQYISGCRLYLKRFKLKDLPESSGCMRKDINFADLKQIILVRTFLSFVGHGNE